MKRRRYDTVELVADLRRERRNAVLLTLTALAIIGFLAAFYFLGSGSSDVAQVPHEAPTPPPAAVAPPPPPVTPPEPEAPKAGPASLTVQLPKKLPLWVDDTAVGKIKRYTQKLAPGKHVVKTRLGKKVVSEDFVVEADQSYSVTLDVKRKRFVVKSGD
ncbi:MAG: hypothetical protein AAB426_03285 [Myxococcota bacterium]